MQKSNLVILGISCYYHDAAVALIVNGEIVFAAEEERFSRVKHDTRFPKLALDSCLKSTGLNIEQIDKIVFYEKPFLKFERILETSVRYAPRGFLRFKKAIPVWLKSKLNMRKKIQKEIRNAYQIKFDPKNILFDYHHISHAASAFYPSGFQSANFIVADGVGEWASLSTGTFNYLDGININKQVNYPHSLGLLYSAFTYFLGFEVNDGEYKMMGLSPFGDKKSEQFKKYKSLILEHFINIQENGEFNLTLDYFSFHLSERMIVTQKWERLFGLKLRAKNDTIQEEHANLALAIQDVLEEILVQVVRKTHHDNPNQNLVMAGGIAYNSVANGRIMRETDYENIWIQPAAGDNGAALVAALHASRLLSGSTKPPKDHFKHALFGPFCSDLGIEAFSGEKYELLKLKRSELCAKIGELIQKDVIVGICQGRLEFGPRALGARSIIANPRNIKNKTIINKNIKGREDFRPFAPIMLLEEATKYFGVDKGMPYMQFVFPIKEGFRKPLPENWNSMSIQEKTTHPTSIFGAITHVDFSSRLQVIESKEHIMYDILESVRSTTGEAILLNTSFNKAGIPIVNSLKDSFEIFENTATGALMINDYLFIKKDKNYDLS